MPFADRKPGVLDVFFPRRRLNPFKGLLDNKDKNMHSRVLRTTWPTKMADTFKVFYGNVNPFVQLKMVMRALYQHISGYVSLIIGRKNDDQSSFSLRNFFVRPIEDVIRSNSDARHLKNKFGLFDIFHMPLTSLQSLIRLAIGYIVKIIFFIPSVIAALFFSLHKSPYLPLKILGAVFGTIFSLPYMLTTTAISLISIALYIGLSLAKAAASAVMTLIAMPIVSIVNFIAYLKSYKLFDDFKTLDIRKADSVYSTYDNFLSEKESSMKEILSAFKREDYSCRLSTNADYESNSNSLDKENESLLIFRGDDVKPSFRITVADLNRNTNARSALYALNMFRIQNAGIELDVLKSSESSVSTNLTTPLLGSE